MTTDPEPTQVKLTRVYQIDIEKAIANELDRIGSELIRGTYGRGVDQIGMSISHRLASAVMTLLYVDGYGEMLHIHHLDLKYLIDNGTIEVDELK